jgi:hypothetical protein
MKKLIKAYFRNIFDGKVTTLVGIAVVILGITMGYRGSDLLHVIELIVLGLMVMGLPDPRRPNPPAQP